MICPIILLLSESNTEVSIIVLKIKKVKCLDCIRFHATRPMIPALNRKEGERGNYRRTYEAELYLPNIKEHHEYGLF